MSSSRRNEEEKKSNEGKSEEEDWRVANKLVVDRNAFILNNELYSDVTFVVGGECSQVPVRIPAHRLILAMASEVFHSMLYGHLKEKDVIEVPDVEAGAFVTLLRFIYTDVIDINAENVCATHYASRKYIIKHLSKACVEFIKSKILAPENACALLSDARKFNEEDLESRCLELIDRHGDVALGSEDFVALDYETVKCILSRDTLICSELNAFNALERWSEAQCLRNGLAREAITAQEKRKAMAEALFLIRFPSMTLEEFTNGPGKSEILTEGNRIDLLLQYLSSSSAKNKPTIAFVTRARRPNKFEVCNRFQNKKASSGTWNCRGDSDSIKFTVSREILVSGYGIYGSSYGPATYSVVAQLMEDKNNSTQVLAEVNRRVKDSGLGNIFQLLFDKDIRIYPGKCYIASVKIFGEKVTFFGCQGQREVSVTCSLSNHAPSVNFEFESTKHCTNGTKVEIGQLPQILFYLRD